MSTVGMPELIIVIGMVLLYVAIPIALIAIALRLVRYGRDQARREYEANARKDPGDSDGGSVISSP